MDASEPDGRRWTSPVIDIDQHYYEADDCCTRHVERRFADRVPRPVATDSGAREWRAGGRAIGFERWVRDVTLAPGAMFDRRSAGGPAAPLELVTTDTPEFRDRTTRLRLLDHWGVDAAVMLPTAGLAWDAELTHEPETAAAAMRAFNRWVEDDWGFAYEGRLFAPPFISLLDVDAAVAELERVLAAGARMILVRKGPVDGLSPAHPRFDPFWARVNEARIPVGLHISVSGYERMMSAAWGEDPDASHRTFSGLQWYLSFATRPVTDTIAAMIFHNLFGRFPNLRIFSIENGSLWVAPFLRDIDVAHGFVDDPARGAKWIGGFVAERPSEIFRRHIVIAPYLSPGFDAEVADLVGLLGPEQVVFGSDWPHGEGRATPVDYLPDFTPLTEDARHAVVYGNAASALGLAAPSGQSASRTR
ncbi:amidohydrolase family protein [Uniformispora flossi]|uniref:amidohydrolase family protein n=1 Tax=Uniformispora flossi TaxID=3390723 RepID=UPI003C2BE753